MLLGGGRLSVTGDTLVGLGNPYLDAASMIGSTPNANSSVLDANGVFVNEGTILAAGAAGNSLTINVGTAVFGGTAAAGYFYNAGTIGASAGNRLTLNIGASSELFNTGTVIANGGSVLINAAASAIGGGYAPVVGFADIQGGGTLETNVGYASTVTGQSPYYAFTDATAGNTLKIDNIGSFGGRVLGFQAGDTIDLGASFAVGTVAFSATTGILALKDASGVTLASLVLASGGFQSGTFAVSSGGADGFIIGTGANGDTVLTTATTIPTWNNTADFWQNVSGWSGFTLPGTLDTPLIGQGASAPFTLTTGLNPVSVGGFDLVSQNALLRITSNTTATPYVLFDTAGTLEVTSGNTLTATALRTLTNQATVAVDAGATLNLTGHPSIGVAAASGVYSIAQGNTFGAGISAGTLVVNGSLLAGPTNAATGGGGSIVIGEDGSGVPASVTVNAGGTVTDTFSLLGSDPTSFGSLTLNGAGASWTDKIDAADPLVSRGFMLLGFNNLSSNTPAGLAPPAAAQAAQLLVENGATLTEQEGAYIADTTNSGGNATITAGGLWNIANNGTGFLNVGFAGNGTLSVLNGGSVAVGNVGTFLSSGTTFTSGGIGVGRSAGASGTISVGGVGSQLSTLAGVLVGQGGQGLLSILNGGTVAVTLGAINVGTTTGATSSGTIVVGGAGAAAALNFAAGASGLTIGGSSQGTLIVSDNGTINLNDAGFLTIGGGAGATGTAVVGGTTASAVINIGTKGLTVGNAGTGFLTVNGGGTIAMTGTNPLSIGQSLNAVGTMTVAGGLVTENGAGGGILLGQAAGASALLQITNAGTVSLLGNGISIGTNTLVADGTLAVQGAGSMLKNNGTGNLSVGVAGHGTLAIGGGGTVSNATFVTAGANAGSSGVISVSGAGSSLVDTGPNSIVIGQAGTGSLTAASGALVQSANLFDLGGLLTGPQGGTGSAAFTGGSRLQASNGIFVWAGSTLSVDATSAIDVGTGGVYTTGAALIEVGRTLWGAGLVSAPVVNNGQVFASNVNTGTLSSLSSGTLDITGGVSGTGTMNIAPGAALRLDGTVGSGQTISFLAGSAPATLILNGALAASNAFAITNLQKQDRLEMGNGVTATSAVLAGSTLTVNYHVGAGANQTYQFTHVGTAAGAPTTFTTGTDAITGDTFAQLACFAEGTRLRTTRGLVPVEHLREGMELHTLLGDAPEPIVWIGQRTVDCLAHPRPEAVWPVRVAADAFGPGLPARDLYLSPDHAVYAGGVLIPVRFLVNGTSIAQERRDRVAYFHVELPRHDVILAEGLPVESYLDAGDPSGFNREGETMGLPARIAGWRGSDAAALWETRGAARLVMSGPALAAVRRALAERSTARLAA